MLIVQFPCLVLKNVLKYRYALLSNIAPFDCCMSGGHQTLGSSCSEAASIGINPGCGRTACKKHTHVHFQFETTVPRSQRGRRFWCSEAGTIRFAAIRHLFSSRIRHFLCSICVRTHQHGAQRTSKRTSPDPFPCSNQAYGRNDNWHGACIGSRAEEYKRPETIST